MILKKKTFVIPLTSGIVITPMVGQVGITWDAISNASYYNIYYQAGAIVDKTTASKGSALLPVTIITGLTTGTQYAFAITSIVFGRESALSLVSTATPL